MPLTPQRFITDILRNRYNRAILAAWDGLDLRDGWLVAGCLFQTVWNLGVHRAPEDGIKDYDIFYFDADDLSEEAEARVQARVDRALGWLGVPIEVKNQARVHLWYEAKFGTPCQPLRSARDGIDRFLVACTSVGIAVGTDELYAPDGLGDLAAGLLRVNPRHPRPAQFRAKAAGYISRWPWLCIVE